MCVKRRDPWHEAVKKYLVTHASLLATFEGKVIRQRNEKAVLLVQNGTGRAFNSADAFLKRGFQWSDVILVDRGITEVLLKKGDDIN